MARSIVSGASVMKWHRADLGGWASWLVVLGLTLTQLGCRDPKPANVTPATSFQGVRLIVGVVGDPALLRSGSPPSAVSGSRGPGRSWASWRSQSIPRIFLLRWTSFVFPGERLGDLVDARSLAVLSEAVTNPSPPPAIEG